MLKKSLMNATMHFKINAYVITNKNTGKCKYYLCAHSLEGFGGTSSMHFTSKLFEYFYI